MRSARVAFSRFWIIVLILAVLASGCISSPPASSTGETALQLTVFYTSDEHGWMAGEQADAGAANLFGLWRQKGYTENDSYLILSGGDNWTGPAISTWFDGQGMVEVMNAMDYSASVIGNHEFDFGLDTLKTRLSEAEFPYLAANMRWKDSQDFPSDLGILPYTLLQVGQSTVAVIGLTSMQVPTLSDPKIVSGLEFLDYEQTLRQYVPEVRNAGADLVLVPTHVCMDELQRLSRRVADLHIDMFGGGHCHQLLADEVDGTLILAGGYNLIGYTWATFSIDPVSENVSVSGYGVEQNQGGDPDPEVTALVSKWQEKTDAELDVAVGYLENEVPAKSQTMQDLVTETWLLAYPNADVAITNMGGFRDKLPAGELTLKDIISVLPFDNVLVEAELSGSELLRVLKSAGEQPAVGGMHQESGRWILDDTGQPLESTSTYSLLTTDYLYAGGAGYEMLASFDPDAYNTGIDWRQPVIDWISDQKSSPERPLDPALHSLAGSN
ncbi:MAG: bifunctional UDP-sugar hydrolase/5'-nucleotidase [Anaerolineales bacterium]